MPSAENSAASIGIEITPPQKRGATTRAMGSTAIISIAEICSVAFIRPISAVMADPARLPNNRPAPTGPRPRTRDSATTPPKDPPGPQLAYERQRHQHAKGLRGAEALQRVVALQGEHHADEEARHHDDDER